MSASEKGYNYVGKNFVIENNIHIGARKDVDLLPNGVGEVILKHLRTHPTKIGQIDADTEKCSTYSEMRENMTRCALWLEKQCINKGDVIAVCTHNQMDAYIPCFAAFLVGAIYNPWHHELTLKTARHLMKLMQPKIIFVCESAVKIVTQAARLEKVDPHFVIFGKEPGFDSLKEILRLQTLKEVEKFEPEPVKDSTISMVLFSSGTTGLPKGVALSYDMLLRIISGINILPNMESMTFLNYSSLYWISGTFFMIQSLMNTGTRIIHTNSDPEEVCKVIEKYKVTSYFVPPSAMTYLGKSKVLKKYKVETLKTCMTGGARNSREVLEEFKSSAPHVELIQGYGMTELGGVATIQNKDCKGIDSVGFVVENVQVKVVDLDTGKSLGPNQPGEIYVKSPLAMVGYYRNPAATKETVDEEGWVHTGDKAYYTEEGEFFVVDRLKEVMKFRGHQISPSELEELILAHPAIMEVAVVPLPHELDLERPMAFVRRRPGHKITEEEIVEITAELGEMKKLWGGVRFLDEMPYTASGKISRKDLKEMAKALSACKI